MKIQFTTFTIAITTFSALAVSGQPSETKIGVRRHILHSKRSTPDRLDTADLSNTAQDQPEAKVGDEDHTATTEHTHQNEKRAYYGQGTYFYPGEGACGWSASCKDHIAALNTKQYGNTGRRSPDCGRWIRIVNRQTGASTKAQIQDACPGCSYGSLDLSPAAFDDLAPESQGVVQIEWDFV